jgi:hypothetical protein
VSADDSIFTLPAQAPSDTLHTAPTRRLGDDPADLVSFVHLQPGEVMAVCRGAFGVGRSEAAALWALGEKLFAAE